jgi:type VI protein secretion system component Hcp
MADRNTDILMYIRDGSDAVAAEGQSEIDTDDDFMAGFKKGQFFEIEDFDFGIQAVDTDSAAVAVKPPTGGDPHATDQTKARTGQFAKWIQNKTVSMEGGGYPIEMTPFQFTRQLDIASPLLFQRCFQTKPYNSAALVMRKVGDTLYGEKSQIAALPFLRIDFVTILITKIDWDVAEVVKEKCTFVCRQVSVRYRQQASAGYDVKETGGMKLSLVKAT